MAARLVVPDPTSSLVSTITPPPTGVMQAFASFTNTTSTYFFSPSTKNFVLVPLRYVYQAERYLLKTIPRQVAHSLRIDRLAQGFTGGTAAARPAAEIAAGAVAGQAADAAVAAAGETWTEALQEVFGFHNVRSFGGMLSYMTSRWAIACFSMALILNRVTVYAASRHRIHLTWDKRLALRIIPMLLFVAQIHSLLQAIRCQTSPDWSVQRYGTPGKHPALDWSSDGGALYQLSSTLLFWEDDTTACSGVQMNRVAINETANETAPYGSFSLLWPTFLRLCLSHFVETLSCSLQQRPVMTETGMSIFEHSLAFAEAESMVGHSMGLSIFGSPKPGSSAANRTAEVVKDAAIDTTASSRPFVLDRVNVPPEVLLIALISCCNGLTSNIIAVFNKQHKWRFINTAFWGGCFMMAFVFGFLGTTSSNGDIASGFLRFPTVCIVGFIPHFLILVGIIFCAGIYILALLLTAISLGTNPALRRPTSLLERFKIAHENLQASVQVKGFEIRWYEDFYNGLLRIGFAVLSAASEAVFLNEGKSVEVRRFTWLEEERFDELESSRGSKQPSATYFQIQEEYGYPSGAEAPFQSGYGKERKIEDSKSTSKREDVHMHPGPDAVGVLQRTTRFWFFFIFLKGIFYLVVGWIAFGIGSALDFVGITFRPRWLRRIIGRSLKRASHAKKKSQESRAHDYALAFWLLGEGDELRMPRSEAYDIEPEMRRRMLSERPEDKRFEKKLDEKLYDWWKSGGWWGTEDFSGEFKPSTVDDEDTTSVISMSTNASTMTTDDEREWESLSSGQVTPTQADFTRESTPFAESDLAPLDVATLSRLLNPRDTAARAEARILSSHLSAPDHHIVTRSQFRREIEQERSRILLTGRIPPSHLSSSSNTKPTPEEEAQILENLILERRERALHSSSAHSDSHNSTGPLCVVCQSASRTVIAWPCRCLCVCEDCRVSLAMNNFGSCVTCRRDVGGFVRLWVP